MNTKTTREDLLTFFMIALAALYYVVKYSQIYNPKLKVILLLSNFLGIFNIIFFRKINRKMLMIYVLALIVSIIYFILLNNYSILTMFVFAASCEKVDENKIISWLLYSSFIFLIIICLAGVGPKGNMLGMQIGILLLLYICKKNGRLSYPVFSLLFVFGILIAYITSSKVVGVITIVALALTCLSHSTYGRKFLSTKFVMFIFPICCLFNYFFAYNVGNERTTILSKILPSSVDSLIVSLSKLLDAAMSWRLTLTYQSMEYFGCSFFGGSIDVESLHLDEYSYFYLDSGYANILQGWGIIFFVMLLILLTMIMKYFIENQKYEMTIAGICLALWSVNEPILNIVVWDFFIIFGMKAISGLKVQRTVITKK